MSGAASSYRDMILVSLATATVFACMFAVNSMPLATQKMLLAEGGPFETLSALGYLVCIGLMFLLWGARSTKAKWYFPVVLAFFAARELDLDKRPFTEGLLKSRQYIGDTVAPSERLVATLILLGLIATVLTLLWRETGSFLIRLKTGSPLTLAVLIGVLFIGVYKAIDGLGRKLAPFGISIRENLNQTIAVVEEIGELGIPIMFGISIWLASKQKVVF